MASVSLSGFSIGYPVKSFEVISRHCFLLVFLFISLFMQTVERFYDIILLKDSCQLLVPKTGQTCSVYKGHMEAYYLGGGDPSELESFIQENLGSLGTNENYEVAYLGSQLDTGAVDAGSASGNMTAPAPVNKAERSVQPNNRGKRTVTFVGGLLVAGFLAAFLGLFFVLYRRRQKFLAAQDVEIALSKSDLDTDDASLRNRRDNSRGMRPNGELEIGDEYDDDYGNGNYTFDLGSNMKNELFNIHGRAGDAPRQYGIGIEETSDSDNDSWAQTDGTITEIETCLEPITAEI